jgi:hypothetical protein
VLLLLLGLAEEDAALLFGSRARLVVAPLRLGNALVRTLLRLRARLLLGFLRRSRRLLEGLHDLAVIDARLLEAARHFALRIRDGARGVAHGVGDRLRCVALRLHHLAAGLAQLRARLVDLGERLVELGARARGPSCGF